MSDHQFETPRPVRLVTEIGKGSVTVNATETATTRVEIVGRDADQVDVRLDGDQLSVIGPRRGASFFGSDNRLDVTVTLPTASQLAVKTGSADVTVTGTVAGSQVKSGSGDVEIDTVDGPLAVETGSGAVRLEEARSDLRIKSGSGDVLVTEASATLAVSTGSGEVQLWRTRGPVVVKTGSGDVRVGDAGADVTMTTGSGDLVVNTARRGRMTAKGASGDVHVGVPAGVPVWTDISTVSGHIRSNLQGTGAPEDGADHVEVRAKVVSGDVVLTQV